MNSDARYRAVVSALGESIFVFDIDGRVISCNAAAEHMVGESEQALVGTSTSMPKGWEPLRADGTALPEDEMPVQRAMAGKSTKQETLIRFRNSAGTLRWFEMRAQPIEDTNSGRMTAVVLRVTEVTQRQLAEEALRENEALLRLTTEFADVATWEYNVAADLMSRSSNHDRLYGLPWQDNWHAATFLMATHVDDRERVNQIIQDSLAPNGADTYAFDFRVIRPDGSMCWLWVKGLIAKRDETGAGSLIRGVLIDVTSRKNAEAEMRNFRLALDAHAIVAITDEHGVITEVNDKFCTISKYSRTELIGSTHRIINSGHHEPNFFRDLWRTIKSGKVWSDEICNRAKDGELYWEQTTIFPFSAADGASTRYIAIRAEITDRKLAEREAHQMAFYDYLTALPNRRLMADRLRMVEAMCERSGRHGALLLLDLDNFKEVNDSFGHDYGDELLKQVGKRLVDHVRPIDTVARVGGDEFVIILSELSEDVVIANHQACKVAESLYKQLSLPYELNERQAHSSASIGVVIFHGHEPEQNDLFACADMALYKAKTQDKERICVFDASLQQEVLAQTNLRLELRQAVANREFLLHYQPMLDRNRVLSGYEALLRWAHPTKGLMPPSEFIPLLEQTGMIIEVGLWVLEEVCRQLCTFSADPDSASLTISVNISAQQVREPDFCENVISIANGSGVNPKMLWLEMTESMFHVDLVETIAKMNSLTTFGIRFSMDDFGTGYSSLSYLKQLPLDQLKIDKSFVSGVVNDSSDAAIARTILALAKSLSLSVVAEGVEREDQFDFLVNNGCDAFQGYLFGRPAPLSF